MKHLCCVWLSVSDVVDRLGGRVNQPTVSHHLKKLEEANLVLVSRTARRFYTLNQEQLTVCCGTLIRAFAARLCAASNPARRYRNAQRGIGGARQKQALALFGEMYRHLSIH